MGAGPQHNPRYRQLCERLRALRELAGLTQRALAERLKKPYSYVHKVEHGDRRIDPIEFIAWCRACEMDPTRELGRFV